MVKGQKILELVQGQPYALARMHVEQFLQKPFIESALIVMFTCRNNNALNVDIDFPVAVAFWRIVFNEAELDYMMVSKAFRGSSLGQRILETSEQFLSLKGIRRGTLEVSEQNVFAKRIYDKLGYTLLGSRKRYYQNGETALVMEKHFCVPPV